MNQITTSKLSPPTSQQVDQLRVVIARFVLGFPNTGKESLADIAEAYVTFLRSLPVWAVNEACERYAHKQVERKDDGFRPGVDLLYDLASTINAEKIRKERLALPAPPPAAEDMAAKEQKTAELLAKWAKREADRASVLVREREAG
jgi:hypothetical protein